MSNPTAWRRRTVLGAFAALAASRVLALPGSTGPRPAFEVPVGACDCHHHIYDPRFPTVPGAKLTPPPATVADYRRLQQRLGTTRNVVVTPSAYGTDNRCLIDALEQFGGSARGIAVVDLQVTEVELQALHAHGVRGIRVLFGRTNPVRVEDIQPLAERIRPLGWHMQFFMPASQLVELEPVLAKLPVDVVLDHMGHVPQPEGQAAPVYHTVRRLLDSGRGWVKLSGAYMDTRSGAPDFADTSAIARSYIAAAPQRVLWGSNWPHPAAQAGETPVPDDMQLFDLLAHWAPDAALRRRILVDNPQQLFGFAPA
ncbi:amidohydrolase family protein [Pseudomonas sp. S31]|uniref:amidohydrolase family protein n=1 Tax=Pseudomonas sp. S31 TaxID=1564473 RepID=UPI0019149969|nr:amidohydrolase family protein [Pseudomonas sp. S31]MBK4998231.1 amidohydrolase family protein [Pseudomonas sp. S31]